MATKPIETVTVAELATEIGMSPQFVYAECDRGRIPHLRFGTGPKARVKIRKDDAAKYVKSLTVGAKP